MKTKPNALLVVVCAMSLGASSCGDPPPQARTYWTLSGMADASRDRGQTLQGFQLRFVFRPMPTNVGEAARVQQRYVPIDPSVDREPLALNVQVPAGTYTVEVQFTAGPLCSGSRFDPRTIGTVTVDNVVAPSQSESTRTNAVLARVNPITFCN